MILTIGHSTHSFDSFVALLKQHDVRTLADVRSLPGSNRYPHFNQERLAPALHEVGIEYVHIPNLGGHRRPAKTGGFETVRNSGMRGYAQYTQSAEFIEGLSYLLGLDHPAVMCAEAVWWRCHRRLIAEVLVQYEVPVRHIMPNGTLAEPELRLLA